MTTLLEKLKKQYEQLGEEIKKLELKTVIQVIPEKKLEWGETSKEKMNWEEAKKWCEEKGDGWRLPTIIELLNIYYGGGVKGFNAGYYWSSTEGSDTHARGVYFSSGSVYYNSKTGTYDVRCVRNIK